MWYNIFIRWKTIQCVVVFVLCFLLSYSSECLLVHFPLVEPSFVEGEANIDAESVFGDEVFGRRLHPLSADVEE